MTESVTVDNASFDDSQQPDNMMVVAKSIKKEENSSEPEDPTLSDNSQHTTTNNSNHSTESNSNSNSLIRSPMRVESKSNTELSIDNDSASMEDRDDREPDDAPPHPHTGTVHADTEDRINDDIINEIINDSDNLLLHHDTHPNETINPPHIDTPHHRRVSPPPDNIAPPPRRQQVSRAYRTLLVHESKRLKAENGRLLRKVEKMRCIRSSMQNIFDQLKENGETQLHPTMMPQEDRKEERKIEEEEEEELEIEHLNDLHHLERTRHPSHKEFLLSKQKQREERKKLRQQRLNRFAKSRLHQQQLHYNNTMQIQNANTNMRQFIPRICSTPACNHPVRPGGRSICCRGCVKKQHTPTCHQRALKIIEKRRNAHHNNNNNNNDEEQYTPDVIRTPSHYHHKHRHHPFHNNHNAAPHTRRARSHSSSNLLGAYTSHHANKPLSSRNRRRHSMKYLFCDKCRSRFNCVSDLERHKAIHHSPVVAARMHSHSPTRNPRMPPPIPELTASFHTTMPNQTKNKFRYKKSDQTLPTPPNDTHDVNEMNRNHDTREMESNRHNTLSRLGLLGRRIRGGNTRTMMDSEEESHPSHQNRKRKHSLSQLFSTFLPNARRHHEEHQSEHPITDGTDAKEDEKEEKEHDENDETIANNNNNNNNRRRTLSSLLHARRSRHNHTDPHIASDEDMKDIDAERMKIKALRRKLELRKQAVRLGNIRNEEECDNEERAQTQTQDDDWIVVSEANAENKEEEKMMTPPNNNNNNNNNSNDTEVSTLWDELAAIDPDIVSRSDYIHHHNAHVESGSGSSSRPRHRRSNAINIMPFITNSDNDEHDEEEKSMQPIARRAPPPPYPPYTESELAALRRKARERKQRRTRAAMFQVQSHHHHHPSSHAHSNNHNPFRPHRPFRGSSLNASNMACLHHHHSHRRTNTASSIHHRYKRGSAGSSHTYRNPVHTHTDALINRTHRAHRTHHSNNNDNNHRPRLRQPFIPTEDATAARSTRSRVLTPSQRSRLLRRRSGVVATSAAAATMLHGNMNERDSDHDDNASSSSSMYVNSHRGEEIARLLQQRDSLLQHFNDTISRHGGRNSHARSNSFDINALRQRNTSSVAPAHVLPHSNHHNNNHNSRHRHSHSVMASLNRVDLTYLPIRCVQASDIGKGNDSSSNCSICQERFKIGDKVKTLPCFHFFHVEEIDRWLTNSRACPVCRHSIDQINFK